MRDRIVLHGCSTCLYNIGKRWDAMGIKSEKESKSILKQVYCFDGGPTTRLTPALVVVVVVALRAALLVVALVTPGRGRVLGGGGFVVCLLLVVPRIPADDDGLVGEAGGLSFCRLVIVFSLSSPAAAAVRVLVVGLTGAFSCDASFALPLSLAAVVVGGFLTSTFALALSGADVVVVAFLVVEGFAFLGDMGVFLAFRGGSGSTSIEIPNSSSSVISFSTSLPLPSSSNGLAQSSSINVASGARLSADVSIAVESKGSSGFPAETNGGSWGGDALSTVRTRLRGLGLTGEYA